MAAVDDLISIDYADNASGEHVETVGNHAGLDRGFAAGEGAILLATGVGQSGNEVVDYVTIHGAADDDVLNRDRLGAHDYNVVDEVVNHIVADRAVSTMGKGDFLFGARLLALVD